MRTIVVALILLLATFRSLAHAGPLTTLAKHRAVHLERLRAYRDAGQFPTDRAGRPASVFRDHAGRLCPMAQLIAASGHRDLVDYVARTNNTLQLADVTEGPLWDWMLTSGLTREEIIRIQGIMRLNFEDTPGERPPAMVRAERLYEDLPRRITRVLRELIGANEVSLAIAASRVQPKTLAAR